MGQCYPFIVQQGGCTQCKEQEQQDVLRFFPKFRPLRSIKPYTSFVVLGEGGHEYMERSTPARSEERQVHRYICMGLLWIQALVKVALALLL